MTEVLAAEWNTETSSDVDPAGQQAISVALIDDRGLVRQGLVALLAHIPDLRVVAAVSSVDISSLMQANPEVILLFLGQGKGVRMRVAKELKSGLPGARIILMDLRPEHEEVIEFVHAGVSGFLLKDATLESLVKSVRLVAAGGHVLPRPMTTTLFFQIVKNQADSPRLTGRERQVIELIAEGLANKEIAWRLRIATHTIKSHVRNIMKKLKLNTRLQIAAHGGRGGPRNRLR